MNKKRFLDATEKVMLKELLDCDTLNDWEAKFVESINAKPILTDAQGEKLNQIYDKRVAK
jgi:hypothetical protein